MVVVTRVVVVSVVAVVVGVVVALVVVDVVVVVAAVDVVVCVNKGELQKSLSQQLMATFLSLTSRRPSTDMSETPSHTCCNEMPILRITHIVRAQ